MKYSKYVFAAALSLSLSAAALADVKVKGELTVKSHAIADLTASLEGASKNTQYRWKVLSGEPASVIRMGDRLLLSGPPGKYKLCVTVVDFDAKLFDEAEVVVVIGDPSPPPPPPPPPTPPIDDPLVKALKGAYSKETDAKKAEYLDALASLYRQAARLNLSSIKTSAELYQKLKSASLTLLPSGVIQGVRDVIGGELKKVLPENTTDDLSSEQKQRALALFARLGDALTEASK